MSGHKFFEYEKPNPLLLPTVTRSMNQSPSGELYYNPPLTLPDPKKPILPQFDDFLIAHATPPRRYGNPTYGGPYGRLGTTQDAEIVEMKQYLAELPPTISMEARGVFLTTLLNTFNPFALVSRRNVPELYDHHRDRYLAQDIYGGNGLYKAVEEWITLAKGKFPGIREKVKLPWLAMQLRHTILRNPQLIDVHESVQSAIDLIDFFQPHFRKPKESEGDYLDRMSQAYWIAHLELQKLHLLPQHQGVPAQTMASMRRD